jgi:hypothetical protein
VKVKRCNQNGQWKIYMNAKIEKLQKSLGGSYVKNKNKGG